MDLNGRILDKATNESIPFVSIFNLTSATYTSTNALGEFIMKDIHFPQTLILSHVSYETDTIEILKFEEVYTINLNPAVSTLQEVSISSDAYARMLVEEAWDKLIRNSNSLSYGYAFYRMFAKVDSTDSEFQEAIYDVMTNNYKILGSEVKHGRYALGKAAFDMNNFSAYTFHWSFLVGTETKANHFKLDSVFSIKILSIVDKGNHQKIAEIKITYKNRSKTIVYIDIDNYNLYKFSRTTYVNELNFRPIIRPKIVHTTLSLSYCPCNDSLMCLEFIDIKLHIEAKVLFKERAVDMSSHTFFYDMEKRNKNIRYTSNGKDNDREKYKSAGYDPAFWDNNPIFKRTAAEEAIIRSFNKSESLGK